MHHFSNSHLIVRGSVSNGLFLKSSGDIDLDLIIPYSIYSKETFDEELGTTLDGKILNIDAMKKFCLHLYDAIEEKEEITIDEIDLELDESEVEEEFEALKVKSKSVNGSIYAQFYPIVIRLSVPRKNVTRSLPLSVVVNGYPMEVDLFPKFLNKDGKICGIGHQQTAPDGEQYRLWKCESPLPRKEVELSENDRAAALFLKLWRAGLPAELKHGVAGYHIAEVVNELVLHGWFSRKGVFDKAAVFSRMRQIIARLRIEYEQLPASRFLQDTKPEARQNFSSTICVQLVELEILIPRQSCFRLDRCLQISFFSLCLASLIAFFL